MATVTIPSTSRPYIEFEINGIRYSFPSGSVMEVPDEVAELIQNNAKNFIDPLPVTSASGEAEAMLVALIDRTATAIAIPSGVTKIGASAFYQCTDLKEVTIPESVESINNSAFMYCSGIKSITLPKSLKIINSSTFQNCTGLTSITIPANVTSVAGNAFSGCTALTSITIPKGVTSISTNAFANCTALTAVIFEGTPSAINATTFTGCTNLSSITVPWAEGAVANAPWGATSATIHYAST